MTAAAKRTADDPVLAELIAIKRLLIFALMKNGASQGEVAEALGVNQSTISRMFPKSGRKRK